MKRATKEILTFFPNLKNHLNDNESAMLSDETLSTLMSMEQTFLKLAWFFENPDKENFNLETLYKTLEDEWLEFALEVIDLFFKNDTYLIKNQTTSFVTEKSTYLNQSQFADYLKEHGLTYNRSKVNTYMKRGKLPGPDLVVGSTKYWLIATCENYLHDEIEISNSDNSI